MKISCGILVGLLYWSYYGGKGDTIYFFEQAQALFHYFKTDRISFLEWIGLNPLPLTHAEFSAQSEPRTLFFVRTLSFFCALTQSNYFTISIYFSFITAIVGWYFVKTISGLSHVNKYVAAFAFLFIPSVTFWSSGVLKETMMMMFLFVFGISIVKWTQNFKNWYYVIPLIISLWILWKVKYYVPITLVPIVFITLLFSQNAIFNNHKFSSKLVLYFVSIIVCGMSFAFLHPVFNSGRFFELVRISHDTIVENTSEALIDFTSNNNDALFFLFNLPKAWITGIFGPYFWEAFSTFSLFWIVEKTIFTTLSILALFISFRVKFTEQEKWWGIAIILYCSALSTVITLSSPNYGSLVRYQVAYMPFLWYLVLMVLNKHKLNLK
ncbi:hypothetical protein [Marivirga arenosa]|uniref:Uncharacterized protein n=1 Tax=Marivirga arenosa TaxID=3059076 RepID=A0AA51ZXU4_9BACT|nr:hypothetical protein [Marivirga sp. BKB1-2]WNB18707.1 hypothetical protein QYS47_31060 [Marivirga sp. BKB1-2]